ncbi:MAG: hypothetical protein A3F98_03430 [Candidatus Yanofskybacteria bacterium RIFCSPLOWO2_12_FULL_41_8]|nr:MAG: hypothetical protein A3F98_03430 [Candidatus Yanofskybacteria bacterium RIFCSPLOWO2_12_FULL_41_8]
MVFASVSAEAQTKYNLGFGSGLVFGKSKIDRSLPNQTARTLTLDAEVTGKRSFAKAKLIYGPDELGGQAFKFSGLENGFTMKKVSFGLAVDYFYSNEYEPMIREVGLSADSFTRKHYLTLGMDILYGNVNSRHIKGSYSIGAAYIWQDGIFNYKHLSEPITEMYDHDLQPIDSLKLSGAWTKLWKLDIATSVNRVRTREFLNRANTKKRIVPMNHIAFDASISLPIWKHLEASVNGTASNHNHGIIFLGNSLIFGIVIQ